MVVFYNYMYSFSIQEIDIIKINLHNLEIYWGLIHDWVSLLSHKTSYHLYLYIE